MKPHKKEVVVITGASAGVGRATVREFARQGAHIGLLARGITGLEAARAEVELLGGRALAIPADVADPAQVEAAAQKVEAELGPIDIWINNAMTSVFSPLKEMSFAEFKRVTEVNYLGTVQGTMVALKRMLPRDRGVVVQVGSALAYRSIPLQSAYCGSKFAIRGFTDSLRSELLHDCSAVHLTMVHLPAINTPQFGWVKSRLKNKAQPVPPIYQPEVAARAIHWAAHHRRRELYVGFPTAKAIAGTKVMAGVLDRYLARTGYSAQQTEAARDPAQPDNLWNPLDGVSGTDFGAHGPFDAQARDSSLELWVAQNRRWLSALVAGAASLGLCLGLGKRVFNRR